MVFTNVYNPRAAVTRKDEYRRTLIKRGATLGANSTVVCGVTVGEYAFVAAGAVVNRDVKPYALMAGVPAKQIGWMSEHGERLDLPVDGDGEALCPATGRRYRLTQNCLTAKKLASLTAMHNWLSSRLRRPLKIPNSIWKLKIKTESALFFPQESEV